MKIGDRVKVVNRGGNFPGFIRFVKENLPNRLEDFNGNAKELENGKIGTLLFKNQHTDLNEKVMVCIVDFDGVIIVIREDCLKNKSNNKVECIIDGQTIMLSRESVEELKKLK